MTNLNGKNIGSNKNLQHRIESLESRLSKLEQSLSELSSIIADFSNDYVKMVGAIVSKVNAQDEMNAKYTSLLTFLLNKDLPSNEQINISELLKDLNIKDASDVIQGFQKESTGEEASRQNSGEVDS